jgi:hypothetical protein
MQIERRRGDTGPDTCTVSAHGDAANITGCTFLMTLSRVPNPVDASQQVYQIEGVIIDAAAGVVEFSPTAEQANQVGYFYYDIQMTDSYGKVHTPITGNYVYKQDITK